MRRKLSRLTKLLYGSGDLGFSLITILIGAFGYQAKSSTSWKRKEEGELLHVPDRSTDS
jgi:uncharacterized protein YaiE (UPF0345 family)